MTDQPHPDLEPLGRLAERFAVNEMESGLLERDDYPCRPFDEALLNKAGELGFLSLFLPEEQGGTGQGMSALCRIVQALARVDASLAAIVLLNALSHRALLLWGKTGSLNGIGPSGLIAFPAYASPTDLRGTVIAEKVDGGFLLRGTFEYVVLAPVAARLILPARMKGNGKKVFFLVDPQQRGLTVREPILNLGLRACPVADVELDDVLVAETHLLCPDAEKGFPELAAALRPAVAALSLGVLEGSLQTARAYAEERYQGGRMIVEYDQIRLMLADMVVAAEAGRALVQEMAASVDRGTPGLLASAGLILLTDQAARAVTDGVQILGGYGYTQDYGQEKRMRDARQISSLFGGAMAGRLDLIDEVLTGGNQ